MSKIFLSIILFLQLFELSCLAQSDTTASTFEAFLKRLIEGRRQIQNQPSFSLDYSYSRLSFPSNYFKENLAAAYGMNIRYGFLRFDDEYPVAGIFKFTSEYALFGTFSSHFKPASITEIGITSDAWRFGFGLFDGFGYMSNKSRLLLYHSGAINWWHIDFELPSNDVSAQQIMDSYDKTFRFGSYFSSGINYQIFPILFIDIGYEHSVAFRSHVFAKWFVSWMIENISQRWLDFFEDDFIVYFKDFYPIIRLLYKSAASFLIYELRRLNMNWPMSSYPSLSYDVIKIGLKFIF